jgi:hypothetical protein
MSNFDHCHYDSATGLMWCKHPNGKWAPPFRVDAKEKDSSGEESNSESVA